ncbi:ABC transporter ATP-binding protein [Micropruina sonneratiae]|uniref:ABC transporter ATP-binding protein n=1 Tax=Micropruina sonneratiae TaxID=2986940 RepID=UPI002226DA76|nr:ABC transporter ATP-binding protein [Micropruina sp. KQZ13P-5]MCW3159583.1 ABC transporter ATP-binding protein [Micropruina sp. KQZ13P-5]
MTGPLSATGVTRVFANGAGVFDVNLPLIPGQVVTLVGLNGAGKSTLMRLLLGMLRPDSGSVRLAGRLLPQAPAEAWAKVGHLVEYPLAYPELSTRRNLQLSARLRQVTHIDAAVEGIITEFALDQYADRRVRSLSLGNKQRVGLAAALQHDPSVIVLDEPTNSLDPAGVIRLRESLLRRADDGAAVLVSSHHLDEVARIADRIVVMNAGRLIGDLDAATPEIERAFFEMVRIDDERVGR